MNPCTLAHLEFERLVQMDEQFTIDNDARQQTIEEHSVALENNKDRAKRKNLAGTLNNARRKANQLSNNHTTTITVDLCSWIYSLEKFKKDNKLPIEFIESVRQAFIIMANRSKTAARYRKLPIAWLELGAVGAFLEDFVVVMRTPSQVGIANQHLTTINAIIDGVRKYIANETQEIANDSEKATGYRFPFMSHAFSIKTDEELEKHIRQCIDSQGESKRIGVYTDEDTTYYYAIQGIYGDIEFDKRVIRVLTPKSFDDPSTPRLGIHFTKTHFATAIWKKEPTKNGKAKGKEILTGHIMRFDRVIHALSCVEWDGNDYVINEEYAKIRNRMVHGITDMDRPKYQAGLVLDIKKIVETLSPGSVMLNELGTLLVTESIPHDCLLACIHTDEQVNKFWRAETPIIQDPTTHEWLWFAVPVVLSFLAYYCRG